MRPGHEEPALLVMVSLPHMMGRLNWAHQRSLASPASYVYLKDAKAEGRGAWDTTGLSPCTLHSLTKSSQGPSMWAKPRRPYASLLLSGHLALKLHLFGALGLSSPRWSGWLPLFCGAG